MMATKKFLKFLKKVLTNYKTCAIIITQKKKGNKKMKKFDFNVVYIEVSKTSFEMTNFGIIPFSTIADSYEEGRTKALEFAQSVCRCYKESLFFFRVTV